MKKLKSSLKAFVLAVTAVSCAAVIFTGALTARARGEKTIDGSPYTVAAFNFHGEEFEIETKKNLIDIKIPSEKLFQKLKKLLPFTAAGALFGFFETAEEIS